MGDQSSVRGASGTQKKRKAGVRKESVETQEYESYQQNGMDADEDKEELCFVPSAVSSSAGFREARFKCGGRCRCEGFNGWDGSKQRFVHEKLVRRLLEHEA